MIILATVCVATAMWHHTAYTNSGWRSSIMKTYMNWNRNDYFRIFHRVQLYWKAAGGHLNARVTGRRRHGKGRSSRCKRGEWPREFARSSYKLWSAADNKRLSVEHWLITPLLLTSDHSLAGLDTQLARLMIRAYKTDRRQVRKCSQL